MEKQPTEWENLCLLFVCTGMISRIHKELKLGMAAQTYDPPALSPTHRRTVSFGLVWAA
jgi:hypothetical protein